MMSSLVALPCALVVLLFMGLLAFDFVRNLSQGTSGWSRVLEAALSSISTGQHSSFVGAFRPLDEYKARQLASTAGVPRRAVVAIVCDASHLPAALLTTRLLRTAGVYPGDVVLVGDFSWQLAEPGPNVHTVHFLSINATTLQSGQPDKPSATQPSATQSWHVLFVFHPFFARWDVVLSIEAGSQVHRPIAPFFRLSWQGRLLAHSEWYALVPREEWDLSPRWHLADQFDLTNADVAERLWSRFGDLQCDYFLPSLMLFDTKLIRTNATFRKLVDLVDGFPTLTQSQAILNLLFARELPVWQQIDFEAPDESGHGSCLYEFWEDVRPGCIVTTTSRQEPVR